MPVPGPYTTAHGVPVRDAVWTFAPATGSAPPAINDHSTSWIQLLNAPGLNDAPEADDNREPRTNVDGEIIYPGFKLGRTFSLSLLILAEDELAMLALLTGLRRGYTTNMNAEGTFTVTPYSGRGGPVWTFGARILAFDPEDDFTFSRHRVWKYRWAVAIQARMSNPLFYVGATGYV